MAIKGIRNGRIEELLGNWLDCQPMFSGIMGESRRYALEEALIASDIITEGQAHEIIKDFMKKNPEKEIFLAAGWTENDEYVTKAYLDEICSDRPLIMNTGGGHSILCNSKAMEWAGIDRAFAEKYGPALVHVDENGEPDGYVCENPAIELFGRLPVSFEDAKDFLLAWQDIALRNGFVGVADAGADLFFKEASKAYHELEEEGKLKLRTYSYIMVQDNAEDPKGNIARIAEERAKYNGEYYYIVGAKSFLDGVTEAHTG